MFLSVLGLATSVSALLGLSWLVGRRTPTHPSSAFQAMLVSASSPGAALVLAFAGLVLCAWSLRHVLLFWLAWVPGRIEVAEFSAGSKLTGLDAAQLTVQFRQRLSTLSLQSPTPVPCATPERDFVDVLSGSGVDARNVLGSLVGLLRAATPSHAYEVSGVLFERSECPRYGVSVEVVRLPSHSARITVWGATWDAVLTEAADEATAAILPLTRRCRSPWGGWRGRVMPVGLLHAYEQGSRLEHARRYDEALHAYYRAVQADPMNMVLRLRIGQLQERMGLYLDALATYWGMDVASRPAGSPRRRPRRGGPGRRERQHALQSARYRRNVLLGGRVLGKQWRTCPDDASRPSRRDEQRERLRTCLRPRLTEVLRPFAESERVLQASLAEPDGVDDRVFLSLRELFARFALTDCAHLRAELRRQPFARIPVTAASIRLTEECIGIRLTSVQHQLRVLEQRLAGPVATWPPDPALLRGRIRAIERGPWRRLPEWAGRRRSFRLWHEQYNAACAYALALQDRRFEDDDVRAKLARLSVCRLQRATARADSGFIATRRDWLVSEDPDLIGLRSRHEFREFEMLFLPGAEPARPRPRNVQQLESARYVRALLVATAERWHATWHQRAAKARREPDIHLLEQWFGDELRAWQQVRAVAQHHRHPATRFELIRNTCECADRYGFEAPEQEFPRFESALPLSSSAGADCDGAAASAVRALDERLAVLADILRTDNPDEPPQLLHDLEAWGDHLRELDANAGSAPRALLAQLAVGHAGVWQLLGEWLDAQDVASARAEQRFRDIAERTRLLWCTGRDAARTRQGPHAVSS